MTRRHIYQTLLLFFVLLLAVIHHYVGLPALQENPVSAPGKKIYAAYEWDAGDASSLNPDMFRGSFRNPDFFYTGGEGLSVYEPGILADLPSSEIEHVINITKAPPSVEADVSAGGNLPPWRKYAVSVDVPPETRALVTVIIDDVGIDRRRSKQIMALPGPLTLSLLPYARDVAIQSETGRKAGHELMVHMPMEPVNEKLDPGPIALLSGKPVSEWREMLDLGLSSFPGYVGLNNHMGSRLTQDRKAMNWLMAELKDRGLLFIDSYTISGAIAGDVAARHGVPTLTRDVFLDHVPEEAAVHAALRKLESIALENGHAMAIGHPKDATIAGLKEWLPTLKDKGITLVPASYLVMQAGEPAPVTLSRKTLESEVFER